MDLKRRVLIVLFLVVFLAAPLCDITSAANYERVFKLLDRPGGSVRYSLTVSITSYLYNYYVGKNHNLFSSADFAKFVTPYSVAPIADRLWEVYSDDEVFVDAVLGLVHQIPYEVYAEVYPVETLVLNKGDCGGLSLLAASILKAGGLDVVLFEYTSKQHLNVGVHLSQRPTYVRGNVYYVVHGDKNYYIAECTGDKFPDGWRVGECPPELKSLSPLVINVENCEQTAPGQVVASYKTLNSSQISISVSSFFVMENSVVTIAGVVSPSKAENVSIYVSTFGGVWQVLATADVDADGKYAYSWRPQSGGIYYLGASWSGDADYAGADSAVVTLYVIPFYGLVAGVLAILLLLLVIVFWLINRRGVAPPPEIVGKTEPAEPTSTEEEAQPPQEETQPQTSHTEGETTQTQEPQMLPEEAQTQPSQTEEETIQNEEQQPSFEETQPSQSPTEPQPMDEQSQQEPTSAAEEEQTQQESTSTEQQSQEWSPENPP